jgi:hypothetical protein
VTTLVKRGTARRLGLPVWPALVVLCVVVSGCADASAQATVPDHLTFSTAAPNTLTAGSKAALAKLPADTATTEHAVVLSETAQGTWYARVLIRGGVAVLQEGACDNSGWGGDWQPDDWWRQQIAPGDAITWSPKGNDVCPGDIHVSDVGAAFGGGR